MPFKIFRQYDVIRMLRNRHEITSDVVYLEWAHHFVRMALQMFFDESSPLPKASSMHGYYEAITSADSLMMELLRLYLVSNQLEIQSGLVYTESRPYCKIQNLCIT